MARIQSRDATRSSISALLDSARQELLTAIEGLTEEQMGAPLPDGWSVKDILAHVAMWDEMELPDMRRAARGHKPALESLSYSKSRSLIDQWNDMQLVLRKPFPLGQVLTELAEARQALMDFLASIHDTRLSAGFIPAACAVQAQHDQEHAEQIRDWRQKERI